MKRGDTAAIVILLIIALAAFILAISGKLPTIVASLEKWAGIGAGAATVAAVATTNKKKSNTTSPTPRGTKKKTANTTKAKIEAAIAAIGIGLSKLKNAGAVTGEDAPVDLPA